MNSTQYIFVFKEILHFSIFQAAVSLLWTKSMEEDNKKEEAKKEAEAAKKYLEKDGIAMPIETYADLVRFDLLLESVVDGKTRKESAYMNAHVRPFFFSNS
jgi:hypothetical protein